VPALDLFAWWALSISFSSIFLVVISTYLYFGSRTKRTDKAEEQAKGANTVKLVTNFAFVWVLLGLLVFYIFSVQLGAGTFSEAVFAFGNIIVEALLIFYLLRARENRPAKNSAKPERTWHSLGPWSCTVNMAQD
jgi:amino acid transporter